MSSTTTGPGAPGTGAPDPYDRREAAGHRGGADPRGLSSWQLVEAAQTGDAAAFGELYDRYHDVVFRFLVHKVQNRTTAEDLLSDTFLRAFRAIEKVSYQGKDVGAWFITIARNLVLDHFKSGRFRNETFPGEVVEPADPGRSAEQDVMDRVTREVLLRAMQQLNADQRECITLRFLHGLSVAETAVAMERAEGAVKALQHRAVKRLGQLVPDGLR